MFSHSCTTLIIGDGVEDDQITGSRYRRFWDAKFQVGPSRRLDDGANGGQETPPSICANTSSSHKSIRFWTERARFVVVRGNNNNNQITATQPYR